MIGRQGTTDENSWPPPRLARWGRDWLLANKFESLSIIAPLRQAQRGRESFWLEARLVVNHAFYRDKLGRDEKTIPICDAE
jgi:hypothetical protein